jgi:proton-dependent oligopeptide transporter, POT family
MLGMIKSHKKLFSLNTAIYTVYFTAMLDRLNFYGIQASLLIMLYKTFHLSDDKSIAIFGVYSTLGFCLPIIGGMIADKLLNHAKAVKIGLLFALVSFAVLLIKDTLLFHFIFIAIFIVGISLFKSNNATYLGDLLDQNNMKSEKRFTYFYMWMNFGAIVGPFIYGVISIKYSFHAAYTISFVLLAINCVLVFSTYKSKLSIKTRIKYRRYVLSAISILALLIACLLMIKFTNAFSYLVDLFIIFILCYIGYIAKQQNAVNRKRLIALTILNIFSIFFFMLSLQVSSTVLLFISRELHIHIFNYTFPPEFYSSLAPIFLILLSPCFAPLWNRLRQSSGDRAVIKRVLISLICGTAAFFVLAACANKTVVNSGVISLSIILLANLLLGLGELSVGPALTSAVTYLSPKKHHGSFMGLWFFSISVAAFLGSKLAKLSDITPKNAGHALSIYHHTFVISGSISAVSLVVLILIYPVLKRLIPDQVEH